MVVSRHSFEIQKLKNPDKLKMNSGQCSLNIWKYKLKYFFHSQFRNKSATLFITIFGHIFGMLQFFLLNLIFRILHR